MVAVVAAAGCVSPSSSSSAIGSNESTTRGIVVGIVVSSNSLSLPNDSSSDRLSSLSL